MRRMNQKGFTLVEILVVIVIVGILAGLALPKYQKVVEKAKVSEALAKMSAIRSACGLYFAENDTYEGILETNLTCDFSDTVNFEYSISTAGTATVYAISAKRLKGPYANSVITINQDGTISSSNYDGVI